MWLRVRSSMDFPLRLAVIYDGRVFATSRPSDILSLIHPVRKFSQSWLSVIGLLEKGSPSLGIGTFVWSLVACERIRCTRL